MYYPRMRYTRRKFDRQIINFGGLNQSNSIQDNEMSAMTNVSTKNYPYLSPRPSRAVSYTLSGTGYGLTATDTYLAWVDGTSFIYNNVNKGTVAASTKYIVDFNSELCIFPDNKKYNYSTDTFSTITGTMKLVKYGYDANGDIDYTSTTRIRNARLITITPSTSYALTNNKGYELANAYYFDVNNTFISSEGVNYTSFTTPATAYYMNVDIVGTDLTAAVTITNAVYPTETAIPALDYVTTWDNRVWGVKGDEIYASAPGDVSDWTTFSAPSVATDSWNVDTGTGQSFTGIATYRDSVILFKPDKVFQIYGDVPSNFTSIDIGDTGCLSHKSIVNIDGVLYYLGRKGVYAFTGGEPVLISEALDDTYSSGVAGTDGRYYYLSLYTGSSYKMYVYDTWKRIWVQEDAGSFKEYTYLSGYVYALLSDNKIYKFNSGTETVSMTIETKEFTEDTMQKKITRQVNIRANLSSGTNLTVYKKLDNGSYTAIKSSYATADINPVYIPVALDHTDHYQLKLVMVGEGDLMFLEREVYISGKV